MTNNKHKEIMDEVERKSEVINDNLWYVNPENIKIALTEQLEEIERWVEENRTFQHPKGGDEGWGEFKGDWDTFNESVGYHKALDDTLSHLHSKKEEYKKV